MLINTLQRTLFFIRGNSFIQTLTISKLYSPTFIDRMKISSGFILSDYKKNIYKKTWKIILSQFCINLIHKYHKTRLYWKQLNDLIYLYNWMTINWSTKPTLIPHTNPALDPRVKEICERTNVVSFILQCQ